MFWNLATRRDVVSRAIKTAVPVGLVLILINHGDALFEGDVNVGRLVKMMLTLAVPYCVSTVSSVGALRTMQAQAAEPHEGGR